MARIDRRQLRAVRPHLVLVPVALGFVLLLVWILRVGLTDKLTAYRIRLEALARR